MFVKKKEEERVPKTECPFFKKKTFQQNQNAFSLLKKGIFFLKKRAFVLLERVLPLSNPERRTTLFPTGIHREF
jgi:hypothetical protein